MHRTSFLLILAATLLSVARSEAQRIMWWNVENLFDCRHDTLRQDQDFLPDGSYRWTWGRYWHKLDDISRTVAAASSDDAWPMLIGLCEVENDSVLRDLTRRSPLRRARYSYIHHESPDQRGIDVALLYDSTRFSRLGDEAIRIPSVENGFRPTRDILHVWGTCPTLPDTLHIVAVHLPSRAGGGRKSEAHRRLAAATLCRLLDELDGKSVLLMGDFNAEPGDKIFREINLRTTSLVPQSGKELRKPRGTYYFRKLWGYLDHIMVSPRLLPLVEQSVTIGEFSFLLTESGTPFRTFQGPIYKGGISDHLPIWVDLLSR